MTQEKSSLEPFRLSKTQRQIIDSFSSTTIVMKPGRPASTPSLEDFLLHMLYVRKSSGGLLELLTSDCD